MTIKQTLEAFIERANAKHNNRYDYSKSVYTNTHTNIIITCKVHGDFVQTPKTHLKSIMGCLSCIVKKDKVYLKDILPNLENEFIHDASPTDYYYNNCKFDTLTSGSEKKTWWKCGVCTEIYSAYPYQKYLKTQCPYCTGQKVGKFNNLQVVRPDIAAQWSDKNDTLLPTDVTVGTVRKVWWKCDKCTEEWYASIGKRCIYNNGCPYCSGFKIGKYNSLASVFPHLIVEWHPTKNLPLTPQTVSARSDKKAHWICNKGHEWCTYVRSRSIDNTKCAVCARGCFSLISIQWLETIMKNENIHIQHIKNGGEFRIPNTRYHADGYCKETNTVYEFHGDLWHANPKLYSPNELNPRLKILNSEVYQKTIKKENIIKSAGFNLIVMWEYDFKLLLNDAKV